MSIFSQVFGDAGFNSNDVEPQQDFEVIPPGKYSVVCEKAEIKTTKKGDGHYLEVCVSIIDGQHKGRKLWSRMNIDNPSEVAQRIGLSQLSGLCKAVGIAVIRDENELLGKSCVANVKVKEDQNEIRSWSSAGLVEIVAHSVIQAPRLETPPSNPVPSTWPTGTKPPWAR